jgi:hypothetical protein
MVKFLKTVDFGHSWSVEVDEFGRIHGNGGDIGDPVYRNIMCTTQDLNIGLTALGHTTEAYRRLPGGWHPAPPGIPTDLYMCRRFFAHWIFSQLEPSTIGGTCVSALNRRISTATLQRRQPLDQVGRVHICFCSRSKRLKYCP